ncbi:hypothetical protein GCM10010530_22260 [Kribbella aluminosa]
MTANNGPGPTTKPAITAAPPIGEPEVIVATSAGGAAAGRPDSVNRSHDCVFLWLHWCHTSGS